MTSPGRFSAELIASGAIGGSQPEVIALKRHIETAVKFALPPNGEFFSSDLFRSHDWRGLSGLDTLRLPFPAIVMEFVMSQGARDCDAVVLAVESGSSLVMNICLRDESAPHGWNVVLGTYVFDPQTALATSGEPARRFDLWQSMFAGGVDDRAAMYARELWEATANVILPLLSLVEVLQCSNVRAERIDVPSPLVKKRARRGEPSFAYHVLTIPGASDNRDEHGGTHSSPRQHLRRGHIRRLPNTRKIWVNACVVGRREDGSTEKDYRVALAESSSP